MSNVISLNLSDSMELTDETFFQLCQNNRDYRFERNKSGELLIMSPTGGETGRRNIKITTQLEIWSSRNSTGVCFDSSTGFKLPNGSDRSPDATWIKRERWDNLTSEEKQKFPPIVPDFVIELRSRTDDLSVLQNKMIEYQENGVRLGWLIDPVNKQVEIYRLNQSVEIVQNPVNLSGEDVLYGFILDLQPIFNLD